MLERLRQIVTSLVNDPALLQLLRDDPEAFSQHLGLSDGEMQALNGAGKYANRWGQQLASLARSSIAARRWPVSLEEYPGAVRSFSPEAMRRGSGVPITAVVGIVGIVATLSTVAVVAVSKDQDDG